MAAILKEDPERTAAGQRSAGARTHRLACLEKTRETRFQSARDLAFGLEVLSDTAATAMPGRCGRRRGAGVRRGPAVVALSLLAAVASWLTRVERTAGAR